MKQTKVKVTFADLVAPDSFWPYPYSIDQAFGIMQWMVKTGVTYPPEKGRWVSCGVIALLRTQPSCGYIDDLVPVPSVDWLRRCFQWAVLSRHTNSCTLKWREENGISPVSTRWIHFPNEGQSGNGAGKVEVTAVLEAKGKLTTQLNQFHEDAVDIYGVPVYISSKGYRFVLNYGVEGSLWYHELAKSQTGETFTTCLRRARAELDKLTGGSHADN